MLPAALIRENPATCAEPQATLLTLGPKPFITSELMLAPPARSSEKSVRCLTEYVIEEIHGGKIHCTLQLCYVGKPNVLLCCKGLKPQRRSQTQLSDYQKHKNILRHVVAS